MKKLTNIEKTINKKAKLNQGFRFERIAENIENSYNHTEESFHKQWTQGDTNSYANSLNSLCGNIGINNRDKVVAATIIQWLGSNVGMEFLASALKKSGYKVSPIKLKINSKKKFCTCEGERISSQGADGKYRCLKCFLEFKD